MMRLKHHAGFPLWLSFPFLSHLTTTTTTTAALKHSMSLPTGEAWRGRIVARLLRETDVLVTSRAGVDGHVPKTAMMTPPPPLAPGSVGPGRCMGHKLSRFFALNGGASGVDENRFPNLHLEIAMRQSDLHKTEQDPGEAAPDVVELKMERDTKEYAMKTLERMQLSITKKVQGKENGVKGRGQKATSQGGSSAQPTVWKWNEAENTLLEVSPADFALLRNIDFWRDASEARFVITVPVRGTDDFVRLDAVSCPPTVRDARSFEKFDSHLFEGVPVVVSYDLLFATDCQVDWYADGNLACQGSSVFIPTDEHIGCTVRVVLTPTTKLHDGTGCEETFEFKRRVEPLIQNTLLGLRANWCRRISTTPAATGARSDGLRVLSYNILADQNAFSADGREPLYPYVSREILLRKRRFPLILHEVLSYAPDIICLQEVDEIVYDTLLEPYLEPFGYKGQYSGKKNEGTREGCALFWNHRVLNREGDAGDTAVYTSDLLNDMLAIGATLEKADEWTSSKTIANLLNDHETLKHVMLEQLGHLAQLLRFVDQRSGRSLWVLNTHLYFHPKGSHIRLIQMFLVARELASRRERSSDDSAVILCGDFNSSLENAAGKLMLDLNVPQNFRDLKPHLHGFVFERHDGDAQCDANLQEGLARAADFPSVSLPPSFPRLLSALEPSPEFTHYIQVFSGDLDHVLISDHFRCVESAPMPTPDDVTKDVAMPSSNLPSDHVSLVCDLAWCARH